MDIQGKCPPHAIFNPPFPAVRTQAVILFLSGTVPSMVDDIPAALSLLADRGGTFVVFRNLLTATLALTGLFVSRRMRTNTPERMRVTE